MAAVNSIGPCIAGGIMVETRQNGARPSNVKDVSSLYVLDKLAFKASSNLSEANMLSRLDNLIGGVHSKRGREALMLAGVVTPDNLTQLMSLLHEVTMHPRVRQEDLDEIKQVAKYELDELMAKPDELALEMAHGPAFYSDQKIDVSEGVDPFPKAASFMDWNSILALGRGLDRLTIDDVMEYWRVNFVPEKMLLVGAGIPQEVLQSACENTFASIPPSNNPSTTPSIDNGLRYCGGYNYVENADLPLTHLVIAFEGASLESDEAFPLAVLQMLMGGGSSFSAGGPGKGMYSRLYTQVLNRHYFVESCRVFNFAYHGSGLFGIHASGLPSNAGDLVQVVLEQLHGMQQPLQPIELLRAKNQVKSGLLMGLESRMIELEDLADQMSSLHHWMSPTELCRRVDEVTEEDLRASVKKLLSTPLTILAHGPLHRTPSPQHISKLHQQLLSRKSSKFSLF